MEQIDVKVSWLTVGSVLADILPTLLTPAPTGFLHQLIPLMVVCDSCRDGFGAVVWGLWKRTPTQDVGEVRLQLLCSLVR